MEYFILKNIFSGEDIRKQLPQETDNYDKVTAIWTTTMGKMYRDKNALKATCQKGI